MSNRGLQLLEALQAAEDEESDEVVRLREELKAVREQLEATREESISALVHSTSTSRPLTPLTPLPMR